MDTSRPAASAARHGRPTIARLPSGVSFPIRIVYQTPQGLRRVVSDGGIPDPIALPLVWKAARAPTRVVVHAGHVFDGTTDTLRGESDIVIEGGIIREISGHHDDLHVGMVVDARDEIVVPGFIDMHARLDPDYGARFGQV